MSTPLVKITDVTLSIGDVSPVNNLSLEIGHGELLSLVGASGSGKTLTALSIIGLLPPAVEVKSGSIHYKNDNLLKLDEKRLRRIRGSEIAMIFQEPMTSLNPVMTVGTQIGEAIRLHMNCGKKEALERAEAVLREVQVPEPAMRLRSYPHQLSGGLRQRVMIAIALSCNPSLLIADEPTTALDVTVQAGVMELLQSIKRDRNLSILLITHDIALAAEVSDRIAVIENGAIIETAPPQKLIETPQQDYSKTLIAKARARDGWRANDVEI